MAEVVITVVGWWACFFCEAKGWTWNEPSALEALRTHGTHHHGDEQANGWTASTNEVLLGADRYLLQEQIERAQPMS